MYHSSGLDADMEKGGLESRQQPYCSRNEVWVVVVTTATLIIVMGMHYLCHCNYSNGEVLVVNRRGLVFCRLIGKVAIEDVTKSSFCHAIAGLTFLPRTDGRCSVCVCVC